MDASAPLDYPTCGEILRARLDEPAPGRIQLLVGPRQVGKTTLLIELAAELGPDALYSACDGPEAGLAGFWERLWVRVEEQARAGGKAVVLLDEIQHLPGWAALPSSSVSPTRSWPPSIPSASLIPSWRRSASGRGWKTPAWPTPSTPASG